MRLCYFSFVRAFASLITITYLLTYLQIQLLRIYATAVMRTSGPRIKLILQLTDKRSKF